MATEELILELNAKVDKAIKDLDDAKDTLKETDKEADKLSISFAAVGASALKMATGALAAAAAITAIAVSSAKTERTMSNLADVAKMSTREFKGLAFAFSQFDVDAKGAADALNDVSERIGEFTAAFRDEGKGAGVFQDFAQVMGLTNEAAGAFALTLQEMSPEKAIIKMVDAMEGAGIHGSEMSFVLKSMSNDLELTAKLFRNNGEQLRNLEGAYLSMSENLNLTTQQSEDISELATSFDLLTANMGATSTMVTAALAPTLTTFFNAVIDIVPDATNTIIDFINRLRDVSELSSTAEIDRLLAPLQARAEAIELEIATETMWHGRKIELLGELWEKEQSINELLAQRIQIIEDNKAAEIALVEARAGGELGNYEEFLEEKKTLDREYADWFNKLQKSEAKIASIQLRTESRQKEAALNAGLNAAKAVNSALLEDNKLVGAGLIVADTAIGMMKAMAQQGAYGFATAAAIGVMGVAQLANLNSAGGGGGSIGGSSTAPTLSIIDIPGQDVAPGASLSATDASGATGFSSNITLEIDGEVIASIVYDNIARLEQDGVIS